MHQFPPVQTVEGPGQLAALVPVVAEGEGEPLLEGHGAVTVLVDPPEEVPGRRRAVRRVLAPPAVAELPGPIRDECGGQLTNHSSPGQGARSLDHVVELLEGDLAVIVRVRSREGS